MSSGTPSRVRRTLARSSPHVETNITAATVMAISGSMTYHPVRDIITPDISTPTDTSVSATMCRYAPFMLRSSLLSFMKSHAVKALTMIPMPATHATTPPSTGCGWSRRWMLSHTIAPMAAMSMQALTSDTRIVLLRYPYVYLSFMAACESLTASNASNSDTTSLRLCPASEIRPIDLCHSPAPSSMATNMRFSAMPQTNALVTCVGSTW